jgi:hypothetical protein
MFGAKPFQCFAALSCSLIFATGSGSARQDFSQTQHAQNAARTGFSALRISLRLQDESAYVGPAKVNVVRSDGTEVRGRRESEGEIVFPDISPGTYSLETSAPGFLPMRQDVQIEAGHSHLTRFVIMKAKTVQPPAAQASPTAQPVNSSRLSWRPPRVDDSPHWVDPEVVCPLSDILNGAGHRMEQFVGDLEKFSATERVEHQTIDATGLRKSPEVREFNYVVTVKRTSKDVFLLDEYRNGSNDPEQFPARIATQGMPAIALLFHPVLASDFSFTCEGLGELEGRNTWEVHFVQRLDRAGRILGYEAGGRYSSLPLKGRAWIDPGTLQVLQIETELARPLPEVALTTEHIAISYQPVPFPTREQKLWLPKVVELYVERRGRRYYRRHAYRDFQLFSVDTTQNIQLAKESYGFTNQSDQDVRGVLTVTPISGTKLDPVSLTFTIRARSTVTKLVGPGKDVGLPVESVGNATFAHDGSQNSVRVDAHLSKESTLDVISGVSSPKQ